VNPFIGQGNFGARTAALGALYEATEGNHWNNHDGWLGPAGSECTWYGVQCEPSATEPTTVIDLDLSENNLRGRIPEAIGQLVHLQTLSFFTTTFQAGFLKARLPQTFLNQFATVKTLQLRISACGMGACFTPEKSQQRTALLGYGTRSRRTYRIVCSGRPLNICNFLTISRCSSDIPIRRPWVLSALKLER
jgi:hypothetical protein